MNNPSGILMVILCVFVVVLSSLFAEKVRNHFYGWCGGMWIVYGTMLVSFVSFWFIVI